MADSAHRGFARPDTAEHQNAHRSTQVDIVAAVDLRPRRAHPAQLRGAAGRVEAELPTAFGVVRELLVDEPVHLAAQDEAVDRP